MEEKQIIVALGAGSITKKVSRKTAETVVVEIETWDIIDRAEVKVCSAMIMPGHLVFL